MPPALAQGHFVILWELDPPGDGTVHRLGDEAPTGPLAARKPYATITK